MISDKNLKIKNKIHDLLFNNLQKEFKLPNKKHLL